MASHDQQSKMSDVIKERSMSLPVHVWHSKRSSSIGRLNNRRSVQIQLTCTLLSQQSMEPKNGVSFPSSVLMQVAIMNGDQHEMHKHISKFGTGIIDEREPSGLPPVMRAIFEGQIDSLQLLIDAGADLTVCDPEKWNVLHVAAAMDDYEAAALIISSCSDATKLTLLQAQNACGEKPVDLTEDKEIIQLVSPKPCHMHVIAQTRN